MIIKSLELSDFRNYDSLCINFDKGVNILYGDNAQGKTNILEAIYVSATTKSHKSSKDKDIINFDKEEAHIRTYLEKDVFDFIVCIDDVEEGVEIGTQRVAGKNCTIYEVDTGYYREVYYVDEESNLIYKSEFYYDTTLGMAYEITEFNTAVTSFEDVELPQ